MKKTLLISSIITLFALQTLFSQVEWTKTFNKAVFDIGTSVQQTNSGGFVMGGLTLESDSKIILAVTNNIGDTIFTKEFSNTSYGPDIVKVNSIQTNDNMFVIGSTFSNLNGDTTRFFLSKTDSQGNELWFKTYSNNGNNCSAFSFIKTNDSGFLIIGESNDSPFIVKTDYNGNKIWDKYIPEMYGYYPLDIIEDASVCYISGFDYINDNIFLMKFVYSDYSQSIVWTKLYPVIMNDFDLMFLPIIKTSDNNLVLTFNTAANNKSNGYLIKTDIEGNMLWDKLHAGIGELMLFSSVETNLNTILSAGIAENEFGLVNIILIETDLSGNFIKQQILSDSVYNAASLDIAKTFEGGYIISGVAENAIDDGDFLLIKIGPDGILSDNINPEIKLGVTVYPNPATDKIYIELPQIKKDIKITLTDINGKQIIQHNIKNTNKTEFNIEKLKPGIYLIKTECEGYSSTEKIVVH